MVRGSSEGGREDIRGEQWGVGGDEEVIEGKWRERECGTGMRLEIGMGMGMGIVMRTGVGVLVGN